MCSTMTRRGSILSTRNTPASAPARSVSAEPSARPVGLGTEGFDQLAQVVPGIVRTAADAQVIAAHGVVAVQGGAQQAVPDNKDHSEILVQVFFIGTMMHPVV